MIRIILSRFRRAWAVVAHQSTSVISIHTTDASLSHSQTFASYIAIIVYMMIPWYIVWVLGLIATSSLKHVHISNAWCIEFLLTEKKLSISRRSCDYRLICARCDRGVSTYIFVKHAVKVKFTFKDFFDSWAAFDSKFGDFVSQSRRVLCEPKRFFLKVH